MTTRKKYSKELKLDLGYTRREAAKGLNINEQMLGRRVKEHRESENGQAFRGNAKLTPEQKEIKRLKAENQRLQMERDI
jgi:transposase-like protein